MFKEPPGRERSITVEQAETLLGKLPAHQRDVVLFALATLDLFGVVSQPKTALGLIFPVLTWLVGLGAVVLLWRRDSTEFFKPQRLV